MLRGKIKTERNILWNQDSLTDKVIRFVIPYQGELWT